MTEIKNETSGQEVPLDNGGEGGERSDKRFKDLSEKVKEFATENERIKKESAEKEAKLLKEKADAEFKANFLEVSSKYPNAKEFEADIKTKVSSGYALEDAIVSTLASKGKLPIQNESKTVVMGGSADTQVTDKSDKTDPSFGGDIGKMREELINLQKKGEFLDK